MLISSSGITLAELKKRAELKKQAEGETALDRAAKRIAAKHGLRNGKHPFSSVSNQKLMYP